MELKGLFSCMTSMYVCVQTRPPLYGHPSGRESSIPLTNKRNEPATFASKLLSLAGEGARSTRPYGEVEGVQRASPFSAAHAIASSFPSTVKVYLVRCMRAVPALRLNTPPPLSPNRSSGFPITRQACKDYRISRPTL